MKVAIRRMDWGTLVVIFLTLALFIVALFVKGFGHGLLLEAGVFLVSVKLILLAYHNQLSNEQIQGKLDQLQELLRTSSARAQEAQPTQPAPRIANPGDSQGTAVNRAS